MPKIKKPRSKAARNNPMGSRKPRRVTKASVNRGFRHDYDTLNSQYTGFHSAVVERSAPRSYDSERDVQFLTHLATTVKEWYKSLPKCSEIEVQIALVNRSYFFISSNKNGTAEDLWDELLTFSAQKFGARQAKGSKTPANISDGFVGMSRTVTDRMARSDAQDAERHRRHAAKLAAALEGNRTYDLPTIHKQEGEAACLKINASEDVGETVRKFVTGQLGTKQFAIVTADTAMHAEQKILMALCKGCMDMGKQLDVIFAGTFRPCRGCYESLNMVQRYMLPNLHFGSRPGHFWQSTTCSHLMIRDLLDKAGRITPHQKANDFDKDGLLKGLTDTSYRPNLRTSDDDEYFEGLHYATDSDSDDDD